MHERSVRRPAAVTFALVAALTWASVAGAAGAVNIASCQTLSTPNTVYNLTADLTSCGDCLVVANNRITIDLQGHSITGACENSAGVTDGGIARHLTVVKNGSIASFTVGVLLASSTMNEVRDIQVTSNVTGIWAGDNSLVTACSATFNSVFQEEDGYGIIVGNRSQVHECDASFNGRVGILAGNHCLITRNTATRNRADGIATGNSCTVSFNTATFNEGDGIDVGFDSSAGGAHSFVTGNTAYGNDSAGIEVTCPSDVRDNTASYNGEDYNFLGTNCHTANNESGPPG
jgi:parallel beta-helix repeat protein